MVSPNRPVHVTWGVHSPLYCEGLLGSGSWDKSGRLSVSYQGPGETPGTGGSLFMVLLTWVAVGGTARLLALVDLFVPRQGLT